MKTILFTGARSGIAASVIDRLLDENFKIYVTVHTKDELEQVNGIYSNYSCVECFVLDVTSKIDREKLRKIDIDIIVLNAALCIGGTPVNLDSSLIRKNYEVNVFSNLELIQTILPNMIKKRSGKIIVMSSLAGIYPVSFIGSYSSSKAALIKITETLRREVKLIDKNIKFCLIEPGFYYTGFNQVMFDESYDTLDIYFKNKKDIIINRGKLIHKFIEKKNFDSIVKKIIKAINSTGNKFIYRAPFLQVVGAKIYSLFFE